MRFSRFFAPLVCLLVCNLLGCGGNETPAATTPATTTETPAVPSASVPGTSSTASSGNMAPDATVRQAITALKENRLEQIWDLLPPSYQKDINDVVREFGKSVDAETWDSMMRTLNRYLSVSLAKQDMIIQTPDYRNLVKGMTSDAKLKGSPINMMDPVRVKAYNAAISDAMIALLGSDIGTVDGLKSFDGKKFTSGGLNVLLTNFRKLLDLMFEDMKQNPKHVETPAMVQYFASLSKLNVAASNVQADSALVTISGDAIPQSIPMVKVEGRWVPQALASNWTPNINQLKAVMPLAALTITAQKSKIMGVVAKVDPLLSTMQGAKTQEEFNAAYRNVQLALMTEIAATTGMAGLAPAGAGGVTPVTVVVTQSLDLATTNRILAELEAASDKPGDAVTIVKTEGGETSFEITPVEDVEAYAKKLTFGSVAEVNTLEKEVRMTVPTAASEEKPATATEGQAAPETTDK